MSRICARFVLLSLAAATTASFTEQAEAATIVYSADFETPVGSEWSNTSRSTTPGTATHSTDRFLGEFGNSTISLTLSNLSPHTQVTLAFDLFVIRTWDGNGLAGDGPDNFDVKVSGGPTLLNTNFANYPNHTQAFPNMLPPDGLGGTFAPQTGASEISTLGYFYVPENRAHDSVYVFNFTFTSSASTLVLNFHASPNEAISNESWGLNNVLVSTTNAVPEPSSFILMGSGVLMLLGINWRRKLGTLALQQEHRYADPSKNA
jgi:hypothetical protein